MVYCLLNYFPSLSFSVCSAAAGIVRKKQWCEMVPCLEDEGCDLLVNKSGWTCTQPGGRVKTTTVSSAWLHKPLTPPGKCAKKPNSNQRNNKFSRTEKCQENWRLHWAHFQRRSIQKYLKLKSIACKTILWSSRILHTRSWDWSMYAQRNYPSYAEIRWFQPKPAFK